MMKMMNQSRPISNLCVSTVETTFKPFLPLVQEPPEPESQKLPANRSEPSLTLWEPYFTISNPNETIHGFPSRPPKSRRRRKFDILASAYSHFPGRLVRSLT